MRAEGKGAGTPGTEIRELHGLGAEAAGQGDAWVKVALGHADARSGSVQASFCLTDVWAALGEFRWQADRDLALGLRHGSVFGQLRVQGLRRLAHQQAKGVDQLVLALL